MSLQRTTWEKNLADHCAKGETQRPRDGGRAPGPHSSGSTLKWPWASLGASPGSLLSKMGPLLGRLPAAAVRNKRGRAHGRRSRRAGRRGQGPYCAPGGGPGPRAPRPSARPRAPAPPRPGRRGPPRSEPAPPPGALGSAAGTPERGATPPRSPQVSAEVPGGPGDAGRGDPEGGARWAVRDRGGRGWALAGLRGPGLTGSLAAGRRSEGRGRGDRGWQSPGRVAPRGAVPAWGAHQAAEGTGCPASASASRGPASGATGPSGARLRAIRESRDLWGRSAESRACPSRGHGVLLLGLQNPGGDQCLWVAVTVEQGAHLGSPSLSALKHCAGPGPRGGAGMWAGFPRAVGDGGGAPSHTAKVWKGRITVSWAPTRARLEYCSTL